ncbi:MAG TPA: hypothetical protein VFS40_02165 [Gemmatimonadales bacterium]|nr:hypothetical protein [Gemmatimonadales bacterium]
MRPIVPCFLLLAAAALAGAACSDPNQLSPATDANAVDTVTLYALRGTPLDSASAFSIPANQTVRTTITSAFDFAYDVESGAAGVQHVFLPLAALGLSAGSTNPGLIATEQAFDQITEPAGSGYTTDSAVVIAPGERYIARSRVTCSTVAGTVPAYAKLEILSVSDAPGFASVTFRVLANTNCGYRSLAPGIPKE